MPNFLDRLTIPEESGLDPTMLVPLLRLLAAGEPVTVEALAAAVGLPVDEVTRRLAAVPDTEYDEQGRIVGQGLTLRPTRHRFTVAGQELYTWCALDTLIFPTILDRPASIESESPVSGHPIRVSVGENGVTSVQPETAVVSLVNPTTSPRSGPHSATRCTTSPARRTPRRGSPSTPKVRSSASLRPTNSAQP